MKDQSPRLSDPAARQPIKKEFDAKSKAFVSFLIAGIGVVVGLFVVMPMSERFGTLFTCLFALLAGMFYTRYYKIRQEEAKKGKGKGSRFSGRWPGR